MHDQYWSFPTCFSSLPSNSPKNSSFYFVFFAQFSSLATRTKNPRESQLASLPLNSPSIQHDHVLRDRYFKEGCLLSFILRKELKLRDSPLQPGFRPRLRTHLANSHKCIKILLKLRGMLNTQISAVTYSSLAAEECIQLRQGYFPPNQIFRTLNSLILF